jgi:general secretion pathway protein L
MSVDHASTLASPPAASRELARRLGVAGFWGWWVAQLAALLPAGVRARWQRSRSRPAVAIEATDATLWRPVVRHGRLTLQREGAVGVDADAVATRSAVTALARASGHALPLAVTLCLPARAVLRKTLTLPAAVEENLRQVLAYDLDRHTPFKADELYFAAAVVGHDAARGTVRVELAAARRSVVDPLIQKVEGWGAQVAAVSPELPADTGRVTLDLSPPEQNGALTAWRRWQVLAPVAVLAVLILAATLLPIWQKREQVIALGEQAGAARAQAAVSESLRSELDRRVGDYNFALERKFAYPSTVQILDDVTRLLPDDTWLTQFELHTTRGKEVTRDLSLRGESANAGRLVGVLEESKLFTQAAPRSPITKIQPGPGEIFDVGAQLKPLPPPASAPLVVTTGKPAPDVANAAAPGAPPRTTANAAPATPANPAPGAPSKAGANPAIDAPSSTAANAATNTANATPNSPPASTGAPNAAPPLAAPGKGRS